MQIVLRKQAVKQGSKYYFTGKMCRNGHLAKRLTSTCQCVECKLINQERYRLNGSTHGSTRKYRISHPEMKLLASARVRSRKFGYPFTITKEDISVPEFCPVLGIKLKVGTGSGPRHTSPTIDRKVPALGYIPGNVWVISALANLIKKNHPIEELPDRVRSYKERHAMA